MMHAKQHKRELEKLTKPGEYPYQCEICPIRTFKKKNSLRKHIVEIHKNQEPETCAICSLVFKNEACVKRHQKTAHPDSLEKYGCDLCEKSFSHPKVLERHMYSAHANRDIKCHLCPKKFRIDTHLKLHLMKKHRLELPQNDVNLSLVHLV